MIRRIAFVLSLALLALMPAVAHGQAPPLNVHATMSTSTVTLGERLRLVVVVQHAADVLVSVEPPTRSAILSLDRVVPAVDTPAGDGVTSQFEYVLAAFALGSVQV